jgi:hypothetical protein
LDITVEANSVASHSLLFHTFFIPGWQATVDGAPAAVRPSSDLALVTVDVPPGRHIVHVWFGDTAARSVSTGLSALSVGLVAILLVSAAGMRTRALAAALALCLAVVLGGSQAKPTDGTRDLAIDFGRFATLAGARVDRTSKGPGEVVVVRLYWYAHSTPVTDYKVFVHLVRPDGGPPLAQHDGVPVGGFTSTTWWQGSELVIDDHSFVLPPDLAPGQYLLVAGLYGESGRVPVTTRSETVDGERVVISELLVSQAP